jgi:hypothetical protein
MFTKLSPNQKSGQLHAVDDVSRPSGFRAPLFLFEKLCARLFVSLTKLLRWEARRFATQKISAMHFLQNALLIPIFLLANAAAAQQSFDIALPDVQIVADRLLRGDGDTYGLGDWQCSFTVSLDGTALKLEGKILFAERANDFTTIVGEYHQRIEVSALARCQHCLVQLDETYGTVSGPNIGARGYRWFGGQGLVRRAKIQTDTFGEDAGHIGGTLQFAPVRVLVDCLIAEAKE